MKRFLTVATMLLISIGLSFGISGCTTVPYTTASVMSSQPRDITLYATIMALNSRGYFLDKVDMNKGEIITRKREHQAGKFWWIVTCKLQENGSMLITVDSNLVKGDKMHVRARHWIQEIESDTSRLLRDVPPEGIREKGEAILKSRNG